MALLTYLCVSSISLTVQRRTPLEIWLYQQGAANRAEPIKSQGNSWSPWQKHSRILLYMHWFRIVSLVNSWVARLLCLPPTFRFVRLGVEREN